MIPFNNKDRIEDTERELAEMVAARRVRQAAGAQGNKRFTYAVKTVASHCDSPNYPASGDTFRVVFLDGKWSQDVGSAGIVWMERDQCYQATVKNMTGQWVPEGTITLATFEMAPAGTIGNGLWLINVQGTTPPTSTSTSTTPGLGPCGGKCRWTWSASSKRWTIATDGCAPTTTTAPGGSTSTTTTAAGGSTTTTCACPTTTTSGTTTTAGSTTTTPAPTCHCLYPTFCGLAEGDCTTTYCAPYMNQEPSCGQTSTTTTPPGGTTTTPAGCDCAGSTTTTAAPPPECVAGCDWRVLVRPTGDLYWARTMTGCVDRCDCLPPTTPPVLCATAHTPCNLPPTTTTAPNPIITCRGKCTYLWADVGWLFVRSTCSSSDGRECKCYPPSEPGSECGLAEVGCVAAELIGGSTSTTTTPVGGSTTTTNPCIPWCQTSTTATTTTLAPTTTTPTCTSGGCTYRWDTTGATWNLLNSNCPSSCPCVPPVMVGYGACHVEHVPCGGGTTTTAPPTTTTTLAPTTTTQPCSAKECTWECRALAGGGSGTWGPWYCATGNEGVGWFLTNSVCGSPSNSPVSGCCCTEPADGFGGCQRVADIGRTATSSCASGVGTCPPFSVCSTTTTTPAPCGSTCYMGCIGGVWVVEHPCDSICPCNGVHYIQGPITAGDPCYEPTGPSSVGGTCGTSTTTTTGTTTTGTTSPPACGGNCTWVWNAGGAMWTKTVGCVAPFPCGCFQPFGGGAFDGETKFTACS